MYPTLDDLFSLLAPRPRGLEFLGRIREVQLPHTDPALGPCLVWIRGKDTTGYGAFCGPDARGGYRQLPAHVWLYQRILGEQEGRESAPVPGGYELHHACHNWKICKPPNPNLCPHRACQRHIQLRTVRSNRLDADNATGRNARKTRCSGKRAPRDPVTGEIIGHDLTNPDNIRIRVNGKYRRVVCVPCEEAEYAERQAAGVG